ncbi:hypothetical protein B0H11DRAFT_2050006, partial [Mycena galericulata]
MLKSAWGIQTTSSRMTGKFRSLAGAEPQCRQWGCASCGVGAETFWRGCRSVVGSRTVGGGRAWGGRGSVRVEGVGDSMGVVSLELGVGVFQGSGGTAVGVGPASVLREVAVAMFLPFPLFLRCAACDSVVTVVGLGSGGNSPRREVSGSVTTAGASAGAVLTGPDPVVTEVVGTVPIVGAGAGTVGATGAVPSPPEAVRRRM